MAPPNSSRPLFRHDRQRLHRLNGKAIKPNYGLTPGGNGRLASRCASRDTPVGMSTNRSHIQLPSVQVAEFCRRHHIRKLALFGSVLHGDARPNTDLDVLVEFEPGDVPGLFRLAGMELELSALLGGRKVGLNTPLCLSRYLRDGVLAEAEPVYAAA